MVAPVSKAQQAPPIVAQPQMLPPVTETYGVPEVRRVNKAVPYDVEQPVIQPYIQRVIRQPVPVITQQIQEIPVPVVHQVQVQGPVQTIEEEAAPAQPIMAQPTKSARRIVAPIQTTKGSGLSAISDESLSQGSDE
jgi:hypothetical protein